MRLGLEAGADTLEAARELGIKGVSVNAADIVANGVEATLDPLRAADLEVCQIGAFGVNPLSDDTGGQEKQQEMLCAAIPLAADTGCRYIVICGGNHHASGFGGWDARNEADDAIDRVAAGLNPLVTLAAAHGVRLSIEPYLKTVVRSPESFWRLRERMDRPEALVANVDVTSLYDFRDYIAPAERCAHVCEGFAGAYGLGHIKDIGLNDGFHLDMRLAPLGTSPTDWAGVLRMMQPHMPEDSWLILEHVSDIEEARQSVRRLRELAQSAGVELE